MKKTFIFIICTLWEVTLHAQVNLNLPVDLGLERGFFTAIPLFTPVKNDIQGTPFAHEEWLPGVLTLSNGRVVKHPALSFRFDGYNNLVFFKNHTDKEMMLVNEGILSLDLIHPDSTVWRFKQFELPRSGKSDYLVRILYENNGITLVKDLRKILYEPNSKEATAYQTEENKKPHYKEVYSYWIKKSNHPFERVLLKKKSIAELAPTPMEKSVESFCDKNGYRNNLSEAEAIDLLKFMFK